MTKPPPLPKDAFDGEKYEAPVPAKAPLPKCPHKTTTLISATELRCTCGAGYMGPNVVQLQQLLNQQ